MDKHIVIIGGGFGGINLAKKLKDVEGIHVTLVDKNNYNFFPPLLYQVATGFLDVSSISTPFRSLFKGIDNIRFRMGELLEVKPESNNVVISTGELQYDALVIATGTVSNFFGMDNIEKYGLPMKTIDDAVEMRNYLLQRTEDAAVMPAGVVREPYRNVVISGAGPTGVEVAGMLAEMRNTILGKIYPEFEASRLRIFLVDAAPTVLPPMREKSQNYTYKALQKIGVEVKLDKMVQDYKDETVYFKDGETIETKTLIWTAGVVAQRFKGIPGNSYNMGNRLLVNEFNQVEGTDNIFAIGDTALQKTDANFPNGHPQLANVAMEQGIQLGRNLIAMTRGEPLKPFRYNDKGSMAIIGRSMAVADLTTPNRTFTGWFAWLLWLFIHLFQLISYRNRIKTMWNWTSAYFTQDQSLGMIVRPSGGKYKKEERESENPNIKVTDREKELDK